MPKTLVRHIVQYVADTCGNDTLRDVLVDILDTPVSPELLPTAEDGTIAQQTVKNIFLSNERTMTRKLEELALAVQLERNYSKEEILELYLNTIYFGHGAYGVGEASRVYFGKAPKDLDLSQCAMLAGLPQAPSAYDPISHPQEGAKRMTMVLALMAQEGYITPEEAAKSAMHLWLK